MKKTLITMSVTWWMEFKWVAKPMMQRDNEYFEEETDGDDPVCGVELKDRTCIKNKKARDLVSGLLRDVNNKKKLKETISKLEEIRRPKKDENKITELLVVLLKRLLKNHGSVPDG